jgi:hypothetical protein
MWERPARHTECWQSGSHATCHIISQPAGQPASQADTCSMGPVWTSAYCRLRFGWLWGSIAFALRGG